MRGDKEQLIAHSQEAIRRVSDPMEKEFERERERRVRASAPYYRESRPTTFFERSLGRICMSLLQNWLTNVTLTVRRLSRKRRVVDARRDKYNFDVQPTQRFPRGIAQTECTIISFILSPLRPRVSRVRLNRVTRVYLRNDRHPGVSREGKSIRNSQKNL